MKKSNSTKTQTRKVKKAVGPIVRLPQKMLGEKIRSHISENLRQSFCAEGVYYSKAKWNLG